MMQWSAFDGVTSGDIRLVTCKGKRRSVQQVLDDCREERRPYLIITDRMTERPLQRILMPVSMLEEEVYKAQIATYLARKTGAELLLLRAHDYGSHARRNTQRIITHIESVRQRSGQDIAYREIEAHHDSFSLMREAATRLDLEPDLILLTASREYGLDDWLFGPEELRTVLQSQVPVMLVNPRADLFSLCD